MILTAYETLACRAYNIKEIQSKLKLSVLEDDLLPLETPDGKISHGVMGVKPENDLIPAFSHPFLFRENDKVDLNEGIFVIDTRGYMKRSRDGTLTIANAPDYKFQLTRGILNLHWLKEPNDLLTMGEIAPLVFIRWITEAIVRTLGVGPADQVKITTVALFYWYSLFRFDDFDEKDRMRIVSKLTQLTAIPANLSLEIADKVNYMGSIQAFTDTLRLTINNPRLDKMNPGFLFSLLGGSWFSANSKEVIAVALEHPPTFLAIVATALESNAYRKTTIGRLVYENDKRGRGESFKKNFYTILGAYKG